MGHRFAQLAFTTGVKAVQAEQGSRDTYARMEQGEARNDRLGDAEAEFIGGRDSFYIATVGETGWPYLQHRGGPTGFLRVLDERTIGFADFRGNRQYISVGNLRADDRVSVMLMDYAARRRLKLLGHARVVSADEDPALLSRLQSPGYKARIERALIVTIDAFDWKCPQHITPRFTATESQATILALQDRVRVLEAALRGQPRG